MVKTEELQSEGSSGPAPDVEGLRALWQEAMDHPEPYVPVEEVFGRLKARYQAMIDAERK